HFPRGEVLRHGSKLATIDWQQSGPRRESDITEMTGYFWKTKDANAFGAFTASLGTGLYHIADEAIAPGMKLWSYGVGKDRVWATLSSARDAPDRKSTRLNSSHDQISYAVFCLKKKKKKKQHILR